MVYERRLQPLFHPVESEPPDRASSLTLWSDCPVDLARDAIRAWHSRLPRTQQGPWKLAFVAHYNFTCFAAALWHNPSARTLPSDWLELRRLAVAPDAPHCTASWMLGAMARWIKKSLPGVPRLISYQDRDVHTGTIYRAAGWTVGAISEPRQRDRSKPRVGTRRDYRSNLNGCVPDAAGKVRWEQVLATAQRGIPTHA
jgi:hypothetical protein